MTVRERITDQPPVQLKAMRERVQALYMQGGDSSRTNRVLSEAFDELALALEQLHAAEQALQRQQSEALNRQAELELDNRRYQDLFEYAPTGYLVTSIDGAIRQANRAALALLQAPERAIAGRALGLFIPEGQRRAFRNSIAQLLETDQPQEWFVTMQSWQGAPFEARLTASVLRGASGKPIAIYWLVHNAG
jgi:PAS domain S-box-containing protein